MWHSGVQKRFTQPVATPTSTIPKLRIQASHLCTNGKWHSGTNIGYTWHQCVKWVLTSFYHNTQTCRFWQCARLGETLNSISAILDTFWLCGYLLYLCGVKSFQFGNRMTLGQEQLISAQADFCGVDLRSITTEVSEQGKAGDTRRLHISGNSTGSLRISSRIREFLYLPISAALRHLTGTLWPFSKYQM